MRRKLNGQNKIYLSQNAVQNLTDIKVGIKNNQINNTKNKVTISKQFKIFRRMNENLGN